VVLVTLRYLASAVWLGWGIAGLLLYAINVDAQRPRDWAGQLTTSTPSLFARALELPEIWWAVLVVIVFLVTAFALWMETRLGHRLALAVVVVDAGLAVWSLVLVGSGPLSISMALGTLFGDIIVGAYLLRPRVREYFF
jgi:hypothetical protein